jgi:hypothetical protein
MEKSTSSFGIELMRIILTQEFPNEDFNNVKTFQLYAKEYFGVTIELSQLISSDNMIEDWELESNKHMYGTGF